ncbi:MAG TPA: hypothetical protein P5243_10640 [Bacteroidales bacterium]|nr:hypothetical protein [Bacteroidales bacterium]
MENIKILRELTEKFYRDNVSKMIMPTLKSMHDKSRTIYNDNNGEIGYRRLNIMNTLANELTSTIRNYTRPDKDLGRFNREYSGIYIVPYSWLKRQLSIYNYNDNILNDYMSIVDDCF